MRYTAQIHVQGEPDRLYECLASESTEHDRSSFRITKDDDGVQVDVKAKDITALRATLNGITQLLTVYEKVGKMS